MVQSALFSQIHYPEVREIDTADQGLEVVPFAIDIYDGSYLVALGQEKYDYSTQYKVIYFPIYLLNRDATKVKSKIGVLEIKTTELVSAYHGSELDPNRLGEPLWFSFVEERFLNQSDAKLDPQSEILNLAVTHAHVADKEDMDKPSDKDLEEKPSDREEDQALELQKPTDKAQVLKPMANNGETAEEQHLKNGIFETVQETQIPVALPEETEKDNEEAKKAFKKTAKNNWMETYMKNNQYGLVDNEGNGDCLFAVIRDAYKQIGKKTTVAKLRAILAKKVTASVYEQYRELHFNYQGEMESLTKQQKDIAKDHKRLGDIAKKTSDLTEQKRLVEEGKMKKEQFDKLKVQLRETKELMKEVEFMKGVDSLEKLRHVLQTVTYWADTWAIGVLEKELNMKMILFSEESFQDGAFGNVLLCGQLNEEIPAFSPDYYILSCYTGNHYQLISYKHKYIFGFEEIPYGVKILIVNKCLERNAGPYYVIPEFRELKRQLGIDPDEGAPLPSPESSDSSSSSSSSSTESPETETEKYIQKTLDLDPGVVFQFHEKADLKKLPGKGSGEMFPTVGNKKSTTIHTDYTMLSSMPQWRRKLDDSWMGVSSTGVAKSPESGEEKLGGVGGGATETETGVFQTPDGHRWASVEHYFHASKFRKMNPDFYAQFALDGGVAGKGGEFSRNLKLARLAGEPFGTLEKTTVKKSEKDLATSAEELDEKYQVVMDKKKVSGGAKEYKRDARIKIDPDFFGGRHLDERKLALRAKFTQNMDLGVLLKETKRAVLRQYHLGKEPVTDYSLMRVRDELIHSVSGV